MRALAITRARTVLLSPSLEDGIHYNNSLVTLSADDRDKALLE
jgi:hypothetical protein